MRRYLDVTCIDNTFDYTTLVPELTAAGAEIVRIDRDICIVWMDLAAIDGLKRGARQRLHARITVGEYDGDEILAHQRARAAH